MTQVLGIPLPTSFLYPAILFLGIPVTLLLLWLTRRSFVKENPRFDDAASINRRKKLRWLVFALRTMTVWLLIVSLATPLAVQNTLRAGDTHITVLLDNSSSMQLMDTNAANELVTKLREQVPVSTYAIGAHDTSNLGEGILSYLKPNENILLVTDGNNNAGPSILDVASFASQANSTISAVKLKPRAFDAAVTIEAPAKAIADTNTTLSILLSRTEPKAVQLSVTIDDVSVFSDSTKQDEITITKSFAAGKHKVSAIIGDPDAIAQNNRYDYLLTVVEKPKVLLVTTKQSGMQSLLSQLYTVTTASSVPTDANALASYYAIAFVDVPLATVSASTPALTQFLLDGNGLFVVGGPHSFDNGNYKASAFEGLLPVTVGAGKPDGAQTNIVVVMDVSGSAKGGITRASTGISGPYPVCDGTSTAKVCTNSLQNARVSCVGGTITFDNYTERNMNDFGRADDNLAAGVIRKSRTLRCENGSSNIVGTAVDFGDHFEISVDTYRPGSANSICLSGVCISNLANGFVSSGNGKAPLIRTLAISVLNDLSVKNNVGVIAVGAASSNASQNVRAGQLIQWDYVGGQQLGGVSPLSPKLQALTDEMGRVGGGGQSASEYWIAAPMKALEKTGGSKNVIIITDGQSCQSNCQAAQGGSDQDATVNLAATIASQGGKVYVVGVTPGENEAFMNRLAEAGNGIFFAANEKNRLHILFGDPKKEGSPESFGLVVLNSNHFITHGVPLQATVFGYNQVAPKNYASMLITAGNGQPALTVWNYGVGRVATLTAYNGEDYGELLVKGNSLILSRTGNWVVGDPERKQASVVTVPHMHVGEQAIITVQSDKIPINDALRFVPKGKGIYEAVFTPTDVGFGSVGGIPYAASYPAEYEHVGMNDALEKTLAVSQGKLFDANNVNDIIDYAQTIRSLQEKTVEPLRYPFLLLAAILFLIEIACRRLYEVFRNRSL